MNKRILRAAALAPLILVLTGCMSMTMDVSIKSDNDISLTMTMGIDDQYLPMLGASDLCAAITQNGVESSMGLPGNVSLTPGTANGQHTCTIAATGLSLSDFSSTGSTGSGLTHANGQYTFTMDMGDTSDLSSYGMSPSDISSAINPFAISVTFPGAVVSSNPAGTVDGNKVTWDDPTDLFGTTPLTAVGNDTPAPGQIGSGGAGGSGGISTGLIIGIIAAVIVIAAVIILIIVSGNRKKAQAAAAQAQYAQAQYAQAQYAQGQYGQPYPTDQYGQPMPQYAPQPPYAQPQPMAAQQPAQYPQPAQYAPPAPPQPAQYPMQYAQPVQQPNIPPVDPYQPPAVPQPAQHAQPDPYTQPPAPPAPPAAPYGQ